MFAEYNFTREATVQKYLRLYVATSHYIHLMQVLEVNLVKINSVFLYNTAAVASRSFIL